MSAPPPLVYPGYATALNERLTALEVQVREQGEVIAAIAARRDEEPLDPEKAIAHTEDRIARAELRIPQRDDRAGLASGVYLDDAPVPLTASIVIGSRVCAVDAYLQPWIGDVVALPDGKVEIEAPKVGRLVVPRHRAHPVPKDFGR